MTERWPDSDDHDALFAPDTYYRVDTLMMFQDLVHTAVLECVDGETAAQGVRGLAGDERRRCARRALTPQLGPHLTVRSRPTSSAGVYKAVICALDLRTPISGPKSTCSL